MTAVQWRRRGESKENETHAQRRDVVCVRACGFCWHAREPGSQVADAFYLFSRESLTLSAAAISQACKTISGAYAGGGGAVVDDPPTTVVAVVTSGRQGETAATRGSARLVFPLKGTRNPRPSLRQRRCCFIILLYLFADLTLLKPADIIIWLSGGGVQQQRSSSSSPNSQYSPT